VGLGSGDVGLGLGLGLGEDVGVGEGEAGDLGVVVAEPVVLGPHAAAIITTATSHTTDLPFSPKHSLRGQTVRRRKRFGRRYIAGLLSGATG
jgi:hypothetical protein